MSDTLTPTPDWKIRLDERNAREHLQWAKGESMKCINKALQILKEVHDKKSYRFDFDSWEDYCQKEWKIGKQRAYQIISGANYAALLAESGGADIVDDLNEGHIRELKTLEPEKAIKIVRDIKASGEKLSKGRIRKAINPDAVLPPERACCPACGHRLAKGAA